MPFAQINIARMLYDPAAPGMSEFMDNLDRINGLAESAPGFLWRMQDETGNATDIRAFDDARMLINMSSWESVETLEAFVYQSTHKQFVARRRDWFEMPTQAAYAIWPIRPDHQPSAAEGIAKLDQLRHDGPNERVFDFSWWRARSR